MSQNLGYPHTKSNQLDYHRIIVACGKYLIPHQEIAFQSDQSEGLLEFIDKSTVGDKKFVVKLTRLRDQDDVEDVFGLAKIVSLFEKNEMQKLTVSFQKM